MNTIKAVFYTDTEIVLSKLEEQGIDTSKCVICGGKIESTERNPRYLSERWQSWRHRKKFYDWNIDAFLSDGVVCDRRGCFINALYRDKKSIDSDKTRKDEDLERARKLRKFEVDILSSEKHRTRTEK